MPRTVRIEYPGAVYHITCRGDRGEAVYRDEGDRRMFLETLAEALLWLVKTVVGDEWVLARLNAGHRSNVSRAVKACSPPSDRKRKVLVRKLHICTD